MNEKTYIFSILSEKHRRDAEATGVKVASTVIKAANADRAIAKFMAISRGEQPDSPALPVDGALRGDIPHSSDERSEE